MNQRGYRDATATGSHCTGIPLLRCCGAHWLRGSTGQGTNPPAGPRVAVMKSADVRHCADSAGVGSRGSGALPESEKQRRRRSSRGPLRRGMPDGPLRRRGRAPAALGGPRSSFQQVIRICYASFGLHGLYGLAGQLVVVSPCGTTMGQRIMSPLVATSVSARRIGQNARL